VPLTCEGALYTPPNAPWWWPNVDQGPTGDARPFGAVEPWTYLRDIFCLLPQWSEHRLLDLPPVAWAKTRERDDLRRLLDQNAFRKLTVDARG
jgi:hypothetical protein